MEHTTNGPATLDLITPSEIEFVRSATGAECFSGYAAVFYNPSDPGTEYHVHEGLKERISRDAFRDTPLEDVELWFEHSNVNTMAEVRTKTLFLSIDSKGLKFDAPFDADDPDHTKALAKIKRKRVNGASIRFTGEYEMSKEGTTWIRTITKIKRLQEFSLVNKPAYRSCAISVRSQELDRLNSIQQRVERAKEFLKPRS